MVTRTRMFVLVAGSFLGMPGTSPADEPAKPDLKLLLEEVRKLVEQYYPKAKVTLSDQTISFEFNTRKYMIHEAKIGGEWQDAFEEVGPQTGGICGYLELRDGREGYQAVLPQSFDKRYFIDLVRAPYSKRLDRHLLVSLKHPSDAPKEFREKLVRLVDGFDKYVLAKDK